MLMELAYRLAVEDTPFIQKIRRDALVLITPIVETDGHDRMVDIYMQHKKHPDQPPYPLIWWGHYVSHDNNRDNLGVSLALSRNMLKTYLDCIPPSCTTSTSPSRILHHDRHGPAQRPGSILSSSASGKEMAHHEIEEMTKRGVIGVWTHGFYDGWAPNYLLSIANNHNSIGLSTKPSAMAAPIPASARFARPTPAASGNRPNPPLPKVKWSARDNINMQESAILFGMNNLASNGQKFLTIFT